MFVDLCQTIIQIIPTAFLNWCIISVLDNETS
nr:MAG TPA: hypothetical protein [Caudoviricetes sp.]DAU44302.1 MAG TPA: hypothetical protein [Caudoviricetes sp.]